MGKQAFLNVGCGSKFHVDWTNVDMKSSSPHVQAHNILQGFPFPADHFEAVYHSQVLEHIPKELASKFLDECLRVLRPGGILRVVVPDLENIANEYLRHLAENVEHASEVSRANYEWIMLELYDQTVRNYSGGQMARYLSQPGLVNESYVLSRSGRVARAIIEKARQKSESPPVPKRKKKKPAFGLEEIKRYVLRHVRRQPLHQALEIGRFRLGGEVHMWMYDRFSLSELLQGAGFEKVCVVDPYKSAIPDWTMYELDVRDGVVCDPSSLFMEAAKPQSPRNRAAASR